MLRSSVLHTILIPSDKLQLKESRITTSLNMSNSSDSNPILRSEQVRRPISSVYSEYIPGNFDWNNLLATDNNLPPLPPIPGLSYRSSDRYPLQNHLTPETLLNPNLTRTPPLEWKLPAVRGRDQPFPPPVGGSYPVRHPVPQNTSPSATPEPLIPIIPPPGPPNHHTEQPYAIVQTNAETKHFLNRPRMYWNHDLQEWRPVPPVARAGSQSDGDNTSGKGRKRDKLRRICKNFILVITGLGSPT